MASCTTAGSIARLLLAFSDQAIAALSGSDLDTADFTELTDAMPYPSYTEDGQADEHGTSYSAQVLFSIHGDSKALSDFERRYINAELGALCILPDGGMRLFLHLSLSRSAGTGQSPPDFNGRSYTLSGVGAEEGLWIDTLI